MNDITQIFFQLLRSAITAQPAHIPQLAPKEWAQLYKLSAEQAVSGLVFSAVEMLPKDQQPPFQLIMEWYAVKEQIVAQNRLLNQRAVEACAYFRDNGFPNTILKGQGIAQLYYPSPDHFIGHLRHSGDIDIWVGGGRQKVYDFARHYGPLKGINYHHIHFDMFKDVEVEVHVTPSDLNNPFDNKALQQLFADECNQQCANTIELNDGSGVVNVPRGDFNLFYVLLHIYHHYLGEGIGLRQLIDYYFVLKSVDLATAKEPFIQRLKRFRMLKFTQGIMWIMQTVFHLDDQYLIVAPDSRRGQVILDQVLIGGNFGHYDPRINRKMKTTAVGRMLSSLGTLMRQFREHPSEIFWNIPFRFAVWFWRSFLLNTKQHP